AVPTPPAGRGIDGLSGPDLERAAFVFHTQHAAQHDGDLLELRARTGPEPAGRRDHPRDADAAVTGIDAARELLNAFWFGAGGRGDGPRVGLERPPPTEMRGCV